MNNDISVIQNALVTIPVALLRQSITLIGAMAIILYLNWKLTGLIFLILPPLMIFARIFGKRLRLFAEKLQDQVAQAVIVLEEVASSIKIVWPASPLLPQTKFTILYRILYRKKSSKYHIYLPRNRVWDPSNLGNLELF